MKNRRKNIIRAITKNINRFMSILIIVAIGSGFMAGLAATSPDMYDTADSYIDSHKLYDIDIRYTGLKQKDVDAIKEKGIADTVMAANTADVVVIGRDEKDYTIRLMGILDENGNSPVNQIDLEEGRFPKEAGECIVESYMGKYSSDSPKIGDVLVVSNENSNYDSLCENLKTTELTVVGVSSSPLRLGVETDTTNSGSGSIGVNVYTLEEQFTADTYSDIYVVFEGSKDYDTFSDEYEEFCDEKIVSVREVMDEQVESIKAELRQEAEDALDALDSLKELLEPVDDVDKRLEDYQSDTPSNTRTEEITEKLDEVKQLIKDIDDSTYIIRNRSDIACISSYSSNVGKIAALSKVFPVFFFLVALLVALTTMTRLVEENRIQIGTLKALGFSNANILGEYILFSSLASILGCVLGFVVGFRLFPLAINSAYSMLYFVPELSTPFRFDIALTVAPVTIGSILLATIFACWSEFRSNPAQLMVPKAPAAGKRIFLEYLGPVWKHMSFTAKVTARNIFRYKKRLFMTIVGVAGCSALLLTGFGLRDSVSDIVDKQYGDINKYELTVVLTEENALSEDDTLKGFLADSAIINDYLPAASDGGYLHVGKDKEKLSIFVPKTADKMNDFVALRTRKGGKALDISEGVIITEKMCEELGLNVGDEISIENSDGHIAKTKLAGITENYIASYAYISAENYKELFGSEPEYTMVMCKCSEDEAEDEDITTLAMKSENVLYARSSSSLKTSFADSIKSINGVIWVLILAAGLLCAVVLYNLTNVNICERRKEIATIRVLGFYQRETEKYIFREINILSFLGGLVGLVLGYFLHAFVISTVEVDRIMFGRDIYLPSYIYSMIITILFTLLVNRLMAFHIRKVDMAAAMKAND